MEIKNPFHRADKEPVAAWVHRIRQAASRLAASKGKVFPVQDEQVTYAEADLRRCAHTMLDHAQTADRGDFLQTVFSIAPPEMFTADEDGEGGIWINEASLLSANGRRLSAILHEMGGARVHDGVLSGCEPAPIIMGC